MTKLLEKIGDWNPQLYRELKGKFTLRNLVLTAGISFIFQLVLCLFFAAQISPERETFITYMDWDDLGQGTVNWQLWSLDLFISLSLIGIFALIVLGTYMLISDLSQEEKQGTLNFIRLSPQSSRSILIGKLLGVPALLFFACAIALPLHLASGLAAQISPILLLGFYGVLGASCFFFYSAALLFALTSAWAKGFQPWFGSGAAFLFLVMLAIASLQGNFFRNFADFFLLFSPITALPSLVPAEVEDHSIFSYLSQVLDDFTWYGFGVWKNRGAGMGLMLANLTLWSYWLWQGLQRRFPNPTATIWSKGQSYPITLSFIVASFGFALTQADWQKSGDYRAFEEISIFLFFLLLLSVGFIAASTTHRPALQEWARYRHHNGENRRSLLRDLFLGEKSPATGAIALNLGLIAVFLLIAIANISTGEENLPRSNYQLLALLGTLLTLSLILLYASIVQRMLLMKIKQRGIWAARIMALLLVFYPLAVGVLRQGSSSFFWLFSPTVAFAVRDIGLGASIAALCFDWIAIALIHGQMARQLRSLGASETKQLLSSS